ncbi:lipopolysaccharide kinase InaA family protein [Anaerospora hongkongensis]|uniref:lipopolysaccharide kinase InaA family protein n=1 Tax=Anaerospora hongkongensis TaxID=244830 RepID=UPI00289AD41E|nr:lipopolysaccharide kinase InaA family protein [Anaerospora hongkongensis]
MNSTILKKKYDSNINVYYQDILPSELAERIINYIWLNKQDPQNDEKFQLVQNTKADVFALQYDNETYYLKSYSFRTTSKIFKNFFRPVEAIRCFQTAVKLKKANIPAAEPILALTKNVNFLVVDSIFVTREVRGVDLHTYLLNNTPDNSQLREKIIKKLAIIWSELINHSFVHLDPGLNNLIVASGKTSIQLNLIDIDAIYSLPYLPKRLLLIKNLQRLKQRMKNFSATTNEFNLFITEFLNRCHVFREFSFIKNHFITK